jgi:hypothetical protein
VDCGYLVATSWASYGGLRNESDAGAGVAQTDR